MISRDHAQIVAALGARSLRGKEFNRLARIAALGVRNRELRSAAINRTNALYASGALKKGPCVVCGHELTTFGHHWDYRRPKMLLWLCSLHHNEVHSLIRDKTRVLIECSASQKVLLRMAADQNHQSVPDFMRWCSITEAFRELSPSAVDQGEAGNPGLDLLEAIAEAEIDARQADEVYGGVGEMMPTKEKA